MEYITYRKKIMCTNCGKCGHEFKSCHEPITSYGIININIMEDINENLILKDKFSTKRNTYYKIISRKYPNIKCYITDNIKLSENKNDIYKLDNETIPYQDYDDIQNFCYYKDKILFMMVSRKFSLGFIEFIRGKYDATNTSTIINLFEQMYEDEIKYIRKNEYDNILYYFLNRDNESKEVVLNRIYEGKYSNEYYEAKIKFNSLKNPSEEDNDIPLDLDFYTIHIKPKWKQPEWGFPKGRRDKRTEENISCACREFEEETGYKKAEYDVLNKIEPIEEYLIGTNGINYKHIYYLAVNNKCHNQIISDYDSYEIGEIKWFTYNEALTHIRPYHTEKKRILTQLYSSNQIISGNHHLSYSKLMIVAHPDDELIFGGKLLMEPGWKIICVTNGSSKSGFHFSDIPAHIRRQEFISVMNYLSCAYEIWDFEDDLFNNNWNEELIHSNLNRVLNEKHYQMIVTHNLDGDSGHRQHKKVSQIVHSFHPQNLYVFGFGSNSVNNIPSKLIKSLGFYLTQQHAIKKYWNYIQHQIFYRDN